MIPEEFVRVYRAANVNEKAVAQSHFNHLCDLLGVPQPLVADPTGERYRFEKAVSKVAGGDGFADVWLAGHFGWEYKGKTKSKKLADAYVQLLAYREDLGNPPLLIVSDITTIEVHTNFTGTQKVIETFTLDDLLNEGKRLRLKQAWTGPQAFNPTVVRSTVTVGAVNDLLGVADALKARGETPERVAHFLVKVVFTLFAEDAGLLPRQTFAQLLEAAEEHPGDFRPMCEQLFTLMQGGGLSVVGRIPHINGGVFSDPAAPDLTLSDVQTLRRTAGRDWRALEPSIFGTLFERIIDPGKRGQLGAHYTPLPDILDVVQPVVLAPLRTEWEALRQDLAPVIEDAERQRAAEHQAGLFQAATQPLWQAPLEQAVTRLTDFQTRLAGVTVLDPGMGSGNFLYVTLRLLLDLEAEVRATLRGLHAMLGVTGRQPPVLVSPMQMRGLEINRYAHEIASMVLWIGYLQWLAEHDEREALRRQPVLTALPGLEHRDAVLDGDRPAAWPQAEFIVGNPPFLGNSRMRQDLGDTYTEALRAAYAGRVPGFADLVAYWFEQAREQIAQGHTRRAGLIATNSIRGGANGEVLARILETGVIFRAWPDRAWTQDGAAVRVSLVAFDDGTETERVLLHHAGDERDPQARATVVVPVGVIHADLTSGADLRTARRLPENAGRSFEGVKPAGKFDVPGPEARSWLALPNPDGVSNADVLRPFIGGEDVTDGSKDRWIVDFNQMPLEEAQQYRRPMQHVVEHVKPVREKNNERATRENWWRHKRAVPALRAALAPLGRYIATPRHMKHRAFVWRDAADLPGDALTVVAAEDDSTFGILNSTLHIWWATRKGTALGVGNDSRYTPTTTFETFPFPHPDSVQGEAIAKAARYLVQARDFLHAQSAPGRPSSVKVSLTGMYNLLGEYRASRREVIPGLTTLDDAHTLLDQAVAAAYGWDWPLGEEEVLERLLALNLERAAHPLPPALAGA